MALDDPMNGQRYVSSREMPHYADLRAFLDRLGTEHEELIFAEINRALDTVRFGQTKTAAELIPGRTDDWSATVFQAIYTTCARTRGVTAPYDAAALRLGQMVKAAIIDREEDWWRIFRSSRTAADGDEVTFAVYEHLTDEPSP